MSGSVATLKRPSFGSFLAQGYWQIFGRQWPAWLGGLLLGIGNIIMFAYAAPWFIYGGFNLVGSWLIHFVGITPATTLVNPLSDTGFVHNSALVLGALVSSLLSGTFHIRMPKRKVRLLDGFIGGLIMGIGVMLAPGCNIGGLFSAMASLSLSGFVMLFALAGGAYLGVLLIRWRVKRELNNGSFVKNYESKGDLSSALVQKRRWTQPIIGLAMLVVAIILFELALGYNVALGIFMLIGLFLGFILQRSGFCFTASFRDMFTTGDGKLARGVILATFIAMLGFSVLQGLGLRQPWVLPVGWHTVIGGIMFGFGMVLAGGCATGTLFRMGEGSVQLFFALLGGMIGAALCSTFIAPHINMAAGIWLPKVMGWQTALFSGIAFLAVWLLVVQWNEWRRRQVR